MSDKLPKTSDPALTRWGMWTLVAAVLGAGLGCPPGDEYTDYRIGIQKDIKNRTRMDCPVGMHLARPCGDGTYGGNCPEKCVPNTP